MYTDVSEAEMHALLQLYDIGDYHSHVGIQAGVSNSNFILKTDQGKFVVTLFEPHRVREEDVGFFLSYVDHLKAHGVGCPQTYKTKEGALYTVFKDRPTGIFEFMRGTCGDIAIHTPKICSEGGALLAKMHKVGDSFEHEAPNLFGFEKLNEWSKSLCPQANQIQEDLCAAIESEMAYLNKNWPKDLPVGPIHGDYFDDNVFYDGETAIGVIDFHFVCTDFYLIDLAIALSAWCFNGANHWEEERYRSFIQGYEAVRPLSDKERAALPVLLRGAAMRFLLSRLEEKLNYKDGDFVVPHDPLVYFERLKFFQTYDG